MEEYCKKYLENTKGREGIGMGSGRREETRKGRGFLKKLSLNRIVQGAA